MDPVVASLLTLAVVIAIKVLYLVATGGFNRMGLALTTFNRP